MLFRVRTMLSDRPGSLADLSRHCGDQGVNILGLQIFPGIEGVTDELVLRVPDGWGVARVAELIENAGGLKVTVATCTEHALVDGPTRYLQAVRQLLNSSADLPEILGKLLDGDTAGTSGDEDLSAVQDLIQVSVGARKISIRRTAAFTATEHARAAAFAELAEDLVEHDAPAPQRMAIVPQPRTFGAVSPVVRVGTVGDAPGLVRMHGRCSSESIYRRFAAPGAHLDERLTARLLTGPGGALVAVVGDEVVGVATLSEIEGSTVELSVLVEDAWQRRGVGTKLLSTAGRMARARGARDVLVRSASDNTALLPLVFSSGLRGRIKLSGDTVVVTASVEGLKPLEAVQPQANLESGASTTFWEPSPA